MVMTSAFSRLLGILVWLIMSLNWVICILQVHPCIFAMPWSYFPCNILQCFIEGQDMVMCMPPWGLMTPCGLHCLAHLPPLGFVRPWMVQWMVSLVQPWCLEFLSLGVSSTAVSWKCRLRMTLYMHWNFALYRVNSWMSDTLISTTFLTVSNHVTGFWILMFITCVKRLIFGDDQRICTNCNVVFCYQSLWG